MFAAVFENLIRADPTHGRRSYGRFIQKHGWNGELKKMRRGGFFERSFKALPLALALILLLVGALRAQSRSFRIGVLTPGVAFDPLFRGLQEGLVRQGYKEGSNIGFIVEDTKGSIENLAARAAKLLSARPDVLFAVTTPHAVAAKQVTATVPIVFAWVGDPVQARLIGGYSSSNNNLTGISSSSDALSGKRLETLLEVAPKVKRLLAIVAPNESIAVSSFKFLQATADKFGVQVLRWDATNEQEIKRALAGTPKGMVDAIYHIPSTCVATHISLLIEKAKHDKIPLIATAESMAEQGALLSYGPDFKSVGIQAARLVAKILKGENPLEVPTETPEKLSLVLNLRTAKAIGFRVTREVLDRADRIVE